MLNNYIKYIPETAYFFCKHNFVQPLRKRPFLPRSVLYVATHRCNARCIMCGIWREKPSRDHELSIDELNSILEDPLFSKLRYVGINGGEPFLRHDLTDIVAAFYDRSPAIKRVSITTNGILTEQIAAALPSLTELSGQRKGLLDISISLHSLGSGLDNIYGVKGAFGKIVKTLDLLKRYRVKNKLTISLNCVLLNENLESARELERWAADSGLPINFVVGELRERFDNTEMGNALVHEKDKGKLVSFLKEAGSGFSLSHLSVLRYRELVKILAGEGVRKLSCYYQLGGIMLGANGQFYYCPHSKEIGNCRCKSALNIYYDPENLNYRNRELINGECCHCPPYTRTRWELEVDMHKVLALLWREKWKRNG